jgi:hypothetical protein
MYLLPYTYSKSDANTCEYSYRAARPEPGWRNLAVAFVRCTLMFVTERGLFVHAKRFKRSGGPSRVPVSSMPSYARRWRHSCCLLQLPYVCATPSTKSPRTSSRPPPLPRARALLPHLRRLDERRAARHEPGRGEQEHGEQLGQRGERVPERLLVRLRGVVHGARRERLAHEQEEHDRREDEDAVARAERALAFPRVCRAVSMPGARADRRMRGDAQLNSPIAIWSAWTATSTVMARKMYTLASRSVRDVWSVPAFVEYAMSLPAMPSAIATVRMSRTTRRSWKMRVRSPCCASGPSSSCLRARREKARQARRAGRHAPVDNEGVRGVQQAEEADGREHAVRDHEPKIRPSGRGLRERRANREGRDTNCSTHVSPLRPAHADGSGKTHWHRRARAWCRSACASGPRAWCRRRGGARRAPRTRRPRPCC